MCILSPKHKGKQYKQICASNITKDNSFWTIHILLRHCLTLNYMAYHLYIFKNEICWLSFHFYILVDESSQ